MTQDFVVTCPSCGGGLELDAASGEMRCPYCGSVFSFEQLVKPEPVDEPAPGSPRAYMLEVYEKARAEGKDPGEASEIAQAAMYEKFGSPEEMIERATQEARKTLGLDPQGQ